MRRLKRADQLRLGDCIAFRGTQGKIFKIEEGHDIPLHGQPEPEIVVYLRLASSIPVPDCPGWKTHYWPLHAAPGDLFEPYV